MTLALVNFWKGEILVRRLAQQRTFDELAESQHLLEFLASIATISGARFSRHCSRRNSPRSGSEAVKLLRISLNSGLLGQTEPHERARHGMNCTTTTRSRFLVIVPASTPRIGRRAIGLDTGCVYGYQLTAYIVEDKQFISVHAHAAYDSPPKKYSIESVQDRIEFDSKRTMINP